MFTKEQVILFKSFVVLAVFAFCSRLSAGDPITIDGLLNDWSSVPTAFSDPAGDGFDEDFGELKITNDNSFLFLNVSFHHGEVLLQDRNQIRLFVDADNDATTGFSIQGIGAEIEWCFGCRSGTLHGPQGETPLLQNDLVMRQGPTVTARAFEIAISLSSDAMTNAGSVIPDTLAFVFATSDQADFLPDNPGGQKYTIDATPVAPPDVIPLQRSQPDHLRIVSYNTLGSGILAPARQPRFQRIIKAIRPDILAVQEQANADAVVALVANWLQDPNWQGIGLGNNNMVLSRFPILTSTVFTNSGRTMLALIDTKAELGSNLLLMNSHLSCCANDLARQQDADEIIMRLRDWRSGNGPFDLAENTPVVHLGDFNLVGFSQQVRTLVQGDISDEFRAGPDFLPDWDGTGLTDLFSRHTTLRMGYTWRSDTSPFSPGKLDYIIYTDSVIDLGNHYILNTLAMSDADLTFWGLERQDTNIASDHLPRIMDVATILPVQVGERVAVVPENFRLFPPYPNPFNPSTTVRFFVAQPAHVSITAHDLLGRTVVILVEEFKLAGEHQVQFGARSLAAGIYFIKMRVGTFTEVARVVLLK